MTTVTTNHLFKKSLLLTGCLLLAFGCAKIQPPPGGPVDTKGPVPVTTIPEKDQTNVDVNTKFEILFDNRLQKTDPNLVSLSPFPHAGLKVVTRGRKLIVEPQELLEKNRTYRLTVSSQLKNERSNPMSQPIELVFSTGDSIAHGYLKGQVFDTQVRRGIWIWGWRIDSTYTERFRNGEPEPWWDVPDVVASTDSAGKFDLSGLTNGKYRLFALDDKDLDHRYDPSNDRLGITFDDAVVPRDTAIMFSFQLAKRDTIPPQILSARMAAPRIATIRFSRPVVATSGRNPVFHALNPSTFVGISYPDPVDTTRWWTIFPTVPPIDSLQLGFNNLVDRQENALPDTTVTKSFPTRIRSDDTLKPRVLSLTPTNGMWVKTHAEWTLQTSTSVEFGGFNQGITALSLSDSAPVPLTIKQADVITAKITPVTKLTEYANIELQFEPGKWKSLTGVTGPDTALKYRYQVLPEDTIGSLHITVDDQFFGRKGALKVEAVSTNSFNSANGWTNDAATVSEVHPDNTVVLSLLPGTYRLRAFYDWNQNGTPDVGHLRPFRFAEPLTIGIDTIRVRSRWTNEGIILRLR